MLKEWIGDLVGQMHRFRISNKDLAAHMGVTPEYVSMVLNGHRDPEGAEQKFCAAVSELIEEKRMQREGGQDEIQHLPA